MTLQKEIDKYRADIKTESYSMSIGEWINMHTGEEIDIHLEFQRFFRWDENQKTKFIESILLGIPIPPIFVSQDEEGRWDVVDGLQRLSTIYEYLGLLKDDEGKKIKPLILEKACYLKFLEGKKWNDPDSPPNSLTQSQRLYIKRAKLHVNIILRESDPKAKYELFQRLNAGGSELSPQEIRNCIIVMLDKSFFRWLEDLSKINSFKETVALTDNALLLRYDLELILRFLIFRNINLKSLDNIGDVGDFITKSVINIIEKNRMDCKKEKSVFKKTFNLLESSLAADSFRRYDVDKNIFKGGFLLSAYETIALGIGYQDKNINRMSDDDIIRKTHKIWSDKTFKKYSGSGVRASSRLPNLIPLGRKIFSNENQLENAVILEKYKREDVRTMDKRSQ